MALRIKNGQSSLEYVIILAVVVGAIVAVGIIFKASLAKSGVF
jgi:uncharacterized protein (UPF0333 family)